MIKPLSQILDDAMPEENHHPKCGCRQCQPNQETVVDLKREARLEAFIKELRTYFNQVADSNCQCGQCEAARKILERIEKVLS